MCLDIFADFCCSCLNQLIPNLVTSRFLACNCEICIAIFMSNTNLGDSISHLNLVIIPKTLQCVCGQRFPDYAGITWSTLARQNSLPKENRGDVKGAFGEVSNRGWSNPCCISPPPTEAGHYFSKLTPGAPPQAPLTKQSRNLSINRAVKSPLKPLLKSGAAAWGLRNTLYKHIAGL